MELDDGSENCLLPVGERLAGDLLCLVSSLVILPLELPRSSSVIHNPMVPERTNI